VFAANEANHMAGQMDVPKISNAESAIPEGSQIRVSEPSHKPAK